MGVSKTKAWANFQKSPFYVLPYHFTFTSVKPFNRQFWGLFTSEFVFRLIMICREKKCLASLVYIHRINPESTT